jgi:hypothetical protein
MKGVLSMVQPVLFRRLILVCAPLLLGVLELWHPSSIHFGEMAASSNQAEWWLTIHLIQLPLFGLLALSIHFLLDQVHNIFTWISRIALAFFIIFYTALDSIAGIATGIMLHKVQSLQLANENDPLFQVAYELFLSVFSLNAPGAVWISTIGILSWFIAGLSAAAALYIKGVNRAGIILIATGTLLFHSHAYPTGPISMLLLLVGFVLVEFFPWKLTEIKKSDAAAG